MQSTERACRDAASIVTDILAQEGLCLDRREWRRWLEFYEPDACYWVPAWRDENSLTSDPDREVSLIFHDSRLGLEDRVVRLESRQSLTAMPLPRTTHFCSNVVVHAAADDAIEAAASWMVHIYQPRGARLMLNFGLYEMKLIRRGETWKFARKKIQLQNDLSGPVIDFYLL
jgi:benzoate/toluate 1,2-dioxygenase beta subunit/2,4,5-trichlorophenoxyacetic acid oxygenase 2